MKFSFTLLLITCLSILHAQVGINSCASFMQMCFGNTVSFPAATDAEPAEIGPDYGCLGSQPNPSWYVFQINQPGSHSFQISNTNQIDLDFILWGPFSSSSNLCNLLNSESIKLCSYSNSVVESGTFSSLNSGEFYVLLITNFSNEVTNFTITQTSGTGSLNCSFTSICTINQFTTNVGNCDTLTNHYSLTGNLGFNAPPESGNLTITAGTQSQQFQAPFTPTIQYVFSGLNSDGLDISVSAVFSDNQSCSATRTITAPVGCLPCQATATSNSPVCVGDTLHLSIILEGTATYQWAGPGGFASSQMSPNISNITLAKAGNYQVVINGSNCVSEKSIDVQVVDAPVPTIFKVGNEVCEGDILFLGAQEVQGADYHWTGPRNFESFSRSTQINAVLPESSGYYYLSLSLNGCNNLFDSLNVTIFPAPEIQVHGDSLTNPDVPSIFYVTGPEGITYYWNFQLNSGLIGSTVYTSDKDTLVVFWDGNEGVIGIEAMAKDEHGCFSNQTKLTVHVTRQTGLSHISPVKLLSCYPNPASFQLLIQNTYSTTVQTQIYDIYGTLKWNTTLSSQSQEVVNTSDWAQGIYILSYQIGKVTHLEKLVVGH